MSIHSQLTGSDLHESKGVATAAAGTVAIATGTGTTNWGTLPQLCVIFNSGIGGTGTTSNFYLPVNMNFISMVLNASAAGGFSLQNSVTGAVVLNDNGQYAAGTQTITAVSNYFWTAGTYITITNDSNRTLSWSLLVGLL